ncbi:MAG: aminoglycoside phosphotransferase/kinase family protein [Mycobacteriales bacterium]
MPGRLIAVEERRLPGGNAGGAVLVGGTVRRPTGPWTPAVHALLRHLEARGFEGAPRVLGVDGQGREILTFLPGATIGLARPWRAWVHSDEALVEVGAWLRRYHDVVADFVPPADARWRTSVRPWRPGDGQGGAASRGRLVGFVDWDFAAPCPPLWDLAFLVFSWVPLHARDVVTAEGFTRFADRPRRLRLLLGAYGYPGTVHIVLEAVRERINNHARGLRELAASGDPLFTRLVADGVIDGLDRALVQLRASCRRCVLAPYPVDACSR